MKIESTMVEMFREEINTVFCLFIANLWAVNKENILKFKKQQKEKRKNAWNWNFSKVIRVLRVRKEFSLHKWLIIDVEKEKSVL